MEDVTHEGSLVEFGLAENLDTPGKLAEALARLLREARRAAGWRNTKRTTAELVADLAASHRHHRDLVRQTQRRRAVLRRDP